MASRVTLNHPSQTPGGKAWFTGIARDDCGIYGTETISRPPAMTRP